MSDQPPDQTDQPHGDHRPTTGDQAPVPIEAAAARLGITVNAVRQRLKRGTLTGERTPAGWVVLVGGRPTDHGATRATNYRPTTTDRPTDQRPTRSDQGPAIDLAPIAAVISDLTRENRQLAEAATAWQVRAMQAEERLKQLTAGEDAPSVPSAAPGEAETPGPEADTPAPWWHFWRR